MDLKIPNEILIEKIKVFATREVRSRQVAKRTRELIPEKLQSICHELKDQQKAPGEVLRTAWAHSATIEYLEQYLNVSAEARLNRIQYETYMMLYEARRSLRLLRR